MSFYFDDDNDDRAFSQPFRSLLQQPSQQQSVSPFQFQSQSQSQSSAGTKPRSQVTFSQTGDTVLSFHSPLPPKSLSQSQPLLVAPNNNNNNNKGQTPVPTFVCHNCGAADDYYKDEAAGGVLTCFQCFTQSQAFEHAPEEEFDYDESQNMAVRNRDGSLKTLGRKKNSSNNSKNNNNNNRNADGTLKRGRPPTPLEDCDFTVPPPPLEDCLEGLGSVLRKSCKLLCLELMDVELELEVVPAHSGNRSSNRRTRCSTRCSRRRRRNRSDGNDGDDSSESSSDASSTDSSELPLPPQASSGSGSESETEQRRALFRAVSSTARDLWKAYLWSWKEGADFYGALYPQVRFCLRDAFLGVGRQRILYHTLAARARAGLLRTVRAEARIARATAKATATAEAKEKAASPVISDGDDSDDSDRDDSDEDEAALLLRPSMGLVAGILLVAGAPHGVTEKQVVDWIENGSLPLLRANEHLLFSEQQQHNSKSKSKSRSKSLAMIASSFFSMPVAPTASQLRHLAKRIHVACGYKPPTVRLVAPTIPVAAEFPTTTTPGVGARRGSRSSVSVLVSPSSPPPPSQQQQQQPQPQPVRRKPKPDKILTAKSLYKPGRLVRPSTVPLLIGKLVSELGFSQIVLNYSLALAGLSVSREALRGVGGNNGDCNGENEDIPSWMVEDCDVVVEPPKEASTPEPKNTEPAKREEPSTATATTTTTTTTDPLAPSHPNPKRNRKRKTKDDDSVYAFPWKDETETPPVFDLTKPEEVIRFKRYKNMHYQRKFRAKQREQQHAKHVCSEDDGDGDDGDNSSVDTKNLVRDMNKDIDDEDGDGETNEDEEGGIEDEATKDSENISAKSESSRSADEPRDERGADEKGEVLPPTMSERPPVVVHKRRRTWLPSPILGARPDKLSDLDRILAVVVVACKLIPGWDQNHRYRFARGGGTEESSGSASGSHGIRATDRFVPWNQSHFRFIGNGRTERDYLQFLEEFVFPGSNHHALPKFVESLKDSTAAAAAATNDDGVYNDFHHHNHGDEDSSSSGNSNSDSDSHTAAAVIPNDAVLGWTSPPQEAGSSGVKTNHHRPPRLDKVPYRPTTNADTKGLRTLDSPLGSLIEYIAYKTETRPDLILKHLIELDKELSAKYTRRSRNPTGLVAIPPAKIYNELMGAVDNATNKKKGTARERTKKQKTRTKKQKRCKTPVRSPNNVLLGYSEDPMLSPFQFNDVLTQREPEMEELLSVGETDWV
eukprot:jgi/Psemu1/328622/estExt_fgenesh1_pg.C_17490001